MADYLYIIRHQFPCDDPYYPPYTKTCYIFATEQEALEQYVIIMEAEKEWRKKYFDSYTDDSPDPFSKEDDDDPNIYYMIEKTKIDKIGETSDSTMIFHSKLHKIQKNSDKFEIIKN